MINWAVGFITAIHYLFHVMIGNCEESSLEATGGVAEAAVTHLMVVAKLVGQQALDDMVIGRFVVVSCSDNLHLLTFVLGINDPILTFLFIIVLGCVGVIHCWPHFLMVLELIDL
jgi:hypothetical protein